MLRLQFDIQFPHQCAVAQGQFVSVDATTHTEAGDGVELLGLVQLQATLARTGDDRGGQWVLASLV